LRNHGVAEGLEVRTAVECVLHLVELHYLEVGLGNGIAVVVLRVVGNRIEELLNRLLLYVDTGRL
jgi:hypothetical protein